MSTNAATYGRLPIYNRNNSSKGVESMAAPAVQNNNELRPDLLKVVEDLLGLRALANATGFMTFKSQKEILSRLSPEDMAAVGRALAKIEKQTK